MKAESVGSASGHLFRQLVAASAAGEKEEPGRAAWRLVPGAKSSDHRCPTHIDKSQSASKGWDQAGGASQRGGEAPQAGCAISGMRPGVRRPAGSVRLLCVGGEGCCPGGDPSALCCPGSPALSASWEPQPTA